MFGRQDNSTDDNSDSQANASASDMPINPAAIDEASDKSSLTHDDSSTFSMSSNDDNAGSNSVGSKDGQVVEPIKPPASDLPLVIGQTDDDSSSDSTPAIDENLLNIKRQALQQLSPLVDQLDQTPEEKFRTTMMMIQAADDQSLIKAAYQTAQQIADEKAKAQALLDIVNEINYFTHQHDA